MDWKNIVSTSLLIIILTASVSLSADTVAPVVKLLDVQRIWDQAPHNAFTDLVRFRDQWYCTFREAESHGSTASSGKVRVLVSKDGCKWTSAALITIENKNADFLVRRTKFANGHIDLRDPILTVTPQNELMLVVAAGVLRTDGTRTRLYQSLAWFSKDGCKWSAPVEIISDSRFFPWEVVWHRDKAYLSGYSTVGNQDKVSFYQSENGRKFQVVVDNVLPDWAPLDYVSGETGLLFSEDDICYCLTRRDRKSFLGVLFGQAKPPYTKWTWKRLDRRMHCPKMLQLPDGRIWVASRLFNGKQHYTALAWLDVDKGQLHEVLRLPSGGDESYPGMVYHEGILWISYYSSHEGKTSIYLAKVKMDCDNATSQTP